MKKACMLALPVVLSSALPALAGGYSPLDCAKAGTPAEKAICGHYELGQAEARMATLYQWTTSLVAMGQRGNIQDDQAAFIRKREGCGADIGCIRNAYGARIKTLEAVMDNIRQRGPF